VCGSRRWLHAAAAATLAALAWERAATLLRLPPTDFDDAYMFVRYADNLRGGFGLVWNRGGEHVFGVTSLLHLGVVTALRALFSAWTDARVLGVAATGAGLIALAVGALLCARFSAHPWLRRSPLMAALVIVPSVAYAEAFVFHCGTGMDTMASLVANLALAWAALALAEAPSVRAAVSCAVAGWLAIVARPDNALVSFGVPLGMITIDGVRGERRRLALAFVLPWLVLVGGSLAAARLWLGTALPLSFWAKRPFAYGGFVGEYTWNPFWFLGVFLRAAAPLVVVLVLAVRRRHARRVAALLVPVAATLAALFDVNQIMGHLGRFYFPMLAFFVAAAAVVADGLSPLPRWRPLVARALVAVAVVVGGGAALDAAGRRYEARAATQPLADLGGWERDAAAPLPELDSWRAAHEVAAIAASAPPGTRLAMSEHGLVGARAPHAVIIDPIGLHDRFFALHGFSAAELLRRRPDFIWMPHPDYTQMIRALLDDDDFWRDYDFWPDALQFGVAIRRDGPASALLHRLFAERFAVDYPGAQLEEHRARRLRDGAHR
jgi:hypothetical protein